MKTRKMTAAVLTVLALFGAPLFSPSAAPRQAAEAAVASRDVDRTPYNKNAEVDPYGRGPARPLPAILRERRETVEGVNWKMPWSGFGCFESPGELERLFSILGGEAEEEEATALAGESMAIYHSRYVQRMDGVVTSILESHAAYQGGHRGRYGVTGRNFDSRRGEELALDDVFTDTTALAGKSMAIYHSRYVQRMDGLVTSILESHAAYQGGHRGRYGVTGRNFDSRRGEELALDDVFADTGALPGLIAERLRTDYPSVIFRDDLEAWLSEQMAEGRLAWTMFARGATFYFTPRSIVPSADHYDTGTMIYTATIFFGDAPELFIEPYNFGGPAWSFEVEPFMPVRVPQLAAPGVG